MKDNSYLKYAIYYILFSLILIQLTASCTLLRPKAQQSQQSDDPLSDDIAPDVITLPADSITLSGAKLRGTVNPNFVTTTYYFQWGTTTSYGNTTTSISAGSEAHEVDVSFNLTGLNAKTTYHYRIVATSIAGTSYGNDESFTTGTTELVYIGTNTSGYEEYMNTIDSMIVIKIPAGNFTMGSDAGEGATYEEPEHVVYISEYYIGKYAVTNKQYKKFCDATSRSYPSDPEFSGMSNYFTSYPDYPVVEVSWYDAVSYCAWAGLRLPTEAEWEKASRGSADERTYPWGFTEPYYNGQYYCNYDYSDADGYLYTCPVTAFSIGKSPYGCYNMAGNVWEWCNDWYDESYYSISPSTDPQGPTTGDYKVLRGGSWGNFADNVRSANRPGVTPSYMNFDSGFRCSALE